MPSSRPSIKITKNEIQEFADKSQQVEQQNVASSSSVLEEKNVCEEITSGEIISEQIIGEEEVKNSNAKVEVPNCQQLIEICEEKNTQVETSKLQQLTEICEQVQVKETAPSAPVLEECPRTVVYPVLPIGETSAVSSARELVTIEPYTREELASLYSNWEVTASQEFVTCFVESELRAGACRRHPLYSLLAQYAQALDQLADNSAQLQSATSQLQLLEEKAWVSCLSAA